VRVEVLDADRSSGLVLVEQDRRNQEAAPTIGGLLGGLIPFPGGAILGQVAGKVLAEALGVPPTPEAVKNAIETGDQAVVQRQLSNAEMQMQTEVEKFKATLEDIQNARSTTVELARAQSNIAWGAPVVSVVIVFGFFAVMSMLFIVKVDLPPNSVGLLNVLFGALIPAFGQVCNYWLGSSAGSNDKSAQIAALTGTKPVVKR
jgi:hypothetical protein